jgi:excinuclease UvrABC nuclease subunit
VAAEKFLNDSLDFFKMRRCVDDLNPDPKFPGCIYSEMKMCLAPCFKGCTDEEYRSEVARVQSYLDTGGTSLVREIAAQRETASANLEFENAAAIHARLDKLKPVASQLPELVRRVDRLAGLIVQRSPETNCVTLFRMDAGCLAGPVTFSIQPPEHTKSQSMESRVENLLASLPAATAGSALETMEHLAILKRWYYRSSRVGEILLADDKGTLPMRRVVRGIARVFRGEKPEAETPALT